MFRVDFVAALKPLPKKGSLVLVILVGCGIHRTKRVFFFFQERLFSLVPALIVSVVAVVGDGSSGGIGGGSGGGGVGVGVGGDYVYMARRAAAGAG